MEKTFTVKQMEAMDIVQLRNVYQDQLYKLDKSEKEMQYFNRIEKVYLKRVYK